MPVFGRRGTVKQYAEFGGFHLATVAYHFSAELASCRSVAVRALCSAAAMYGVLCSRYQDGVCSCHSRRLLQQVSERRRARLRAQLCPLTVRGVAALAPPGPALASGSAQGHPRLASSSHSRAATHPVVTPHSPDKNSHTRMPIAVRSVRPPPCFSSAVSQYTLPMQACTVWGCKHQDGARARYASCNRMSVQVLCRYADTHAAAICAPG